MPKKVCEVAACEGCPLRNLYPDNNFVQPRVGTNLRLAIGEAPGATEAEQGTPFVGGSGKWLQSMYGKIGAKEAENSVINVIQCRPPDNIFPTDSLARSYISDRDAHKAVDHCIKAHVEPFLKSRPWKRIDTFGDKPLKFILEKSGGVTLWRGSVLTVPALGARIAVPTFHPAYIARDQSMLPVAINDLRKTLEVEPETYNIMPTLEEVKRFTSKVFAFDIESNRWNPNEIFMVGLTDENYKAIVVPFVDPYIAELKRIFANATEVIGQYCVQFDLPKLAYHGIVIGPPEKCQIWDTILMHHLRFPSFPHDLEFVGKQFTNKGAWKGDKLSFETYCARDVDVTFQVWQVLKQLLEQAKLMDVYKFISLPLAKICKHMTDAGVYTSGDRIKELRIELKKNIEEEEKKLPPHLQTFFVTKRKRVLAPAGTLNDKGKPVKYLYEPYDEPVVPWRSPEVKKAYLYDELKLPVQLHIKSKNPTADKSALDKLYRRHKLPELAALKNLSKWATLLQNFAKEVVGDQTTLHPTFAVQGTETGRLSSANPNIQNQPGTVRFTFISRYENGRILSIDYSGIENRLVAWAARDKQRMKWFEDPKFSEHKYLCSIFTGIPYAEVEKSKDKDSPYAMAKVIVHGSDRMMGSKKISEQYDIDFDEVKRLQAIWKSEIRDTILWQVKIANDAKRIGWVVNAFGRKLWLWETNSATRAVSFWPQSTAFDVIARAMIGLMYERIGWPKAWAEKVCPLCIPLPAGELIMQVHDELVVDSPPESVEACMETLIKVMTQPWPELNGLSLPIGKGVGVSWGDCE